MVNWLKERVETRLEKLGLGPIEAATAIGIERSFIRDILQGKKASVRADGAAKLQEALKAPKEWFLYENFSYDHEWDDPTWGKFGEPSDNQLATPIASQERPAPTDQDKIQVRQLDIRFGMGGGAHYDAPVESKPMSFSREWLAQLTTAKPETLFWASGFGDSMYPTIGDRDLVLVDTAQKEPRIRDQIWALNQYGQGMIKRLRATEDGYLILSDNREVPPDTATDGSMEVVGRVVAIIRRV